FSTSPELYQHACGRAFGDGRVCTTHVSETREEVEFIRNGTGPLQELLTRLGVAVGDFKGYGESPMTLLLRDWLGPWLPQGAPDVSPGPVADRPRADARGSLPQLVLVHGNYPEGEDLKWIEQ